MSKLRDPSQYHTTKSYQFFTWLKGDKDPYLDCVEMKPQHSRDATEEIRALHGKERQEMLHKVYDVESNREIKTLSTFYLFASVIFSITLLTVLTITVSHLPPNADPSNPANNEVAQRYIERTIEETGATNAVASMITQYRGFDTFGEAHVLFVATICVMILLAINNHDDKKLMEADMQVFEPKNDRILQVSSFVLIPMVFMFGIYVILNGHLSPGGGFAGGSIIGAGLILYNSSYGFARTQQFFGEEEYKMIKVTCLLLYALIMGIYFYTGANGISLTLPLGKPGSILSAGFILPVNILVGLEVACTMYAFFAFFRKGDL